MGRSDAIFVEMKRETAALNEAKIASGQEEGKRAVNKRSGTVDRTAAAP
jgi:hypothetical protein